MTDLRDPEPRARDLEATPRTSFVRRALAPIRRVPGTELLLSSSRQIQLRAPRIFDVDLETQNYSGIIRWSFVALVIVPMCIAAIYLFFIASDQYVAEARFAIRQADPVSGMQVAQDKSDIKTASPLGLSLNLRSQNAEIVANYINSRAIIEDVARTVDVGRIFRRPEADWFARLPNNAPIEEVEKYWEKMVTVYVETASGIVTVDASAFRRDDALELVKAVLASSETLVNSLSAKMRADQTQLAEDEVRRAEGGVRFALAELQTFRNAEHLIDPVKTSESTMKLMMQMMTTRIESEAQLYVAERTQGPDAPGMRSLHAKIDSANVQIRTLQDQLAGDKEASKNMAATLSRFEELELKKRFTEHVLTFAESSLERARIAALRQTIYLSVFAPPTLPQEYTYPRRITDFLLISIAAFMLWVCGLTMSASVLDHRI